MDRRGERWELLGGHLDPTDEGRKKALMREVLEESRLEGLFGQHLIFSQDEVKNGHLRLYDVYAGHYYEEAMPEPLLKEGIEELKWFSLEEAKKLNLTGMARKAIEFLSNKNEESFLSECLHNFQVVVNLAQARGVDPEEMMDLKKTMSKSIDVLSKGNQMKIKVQENRQIKGSVLVVNDHYLVLDTLKRLFEVRGYKVYAFGRADEALVWLNTSSIVKSIKAMVVDYRKNGVSGNFLIKKAKDHLSPRVSTILISSEDSSEIDMADETIFLKKTFSARRSYKSRRAELNLR